MGKAKQNKFDLWIYPKQCVPYRNLSINPLILPLWFSEEIRVNRWWLEVGSFRTLNEDDIYYIII